MNYDRNFYWPSNSYSYILWIARDYIYCVYDEKHLIYLLFMRFKLNVIRAVVSHSIVWLMIHIVHTTVQLTVMLTDKKPNNFVDLRFNNIIIKRCLVTDHLPIIYQSFTAYFCIYSNAKINHMVTNSQEEFEIFSWHSSQIFKKSILIFYLLLLLLHMNLLADNENNWVCCGRLHISMLSNIEEKTKKQKKILLTDIHCMLCSWYIYMYIYCVYSNSKCMHYCIYCIEIYRVPIRVSANKHNSIIIYYCWRSTN